jgi:hypothetical protein
MAPQPPAELREGIRVGIELADGSTCVAQIERLAGDAVHMKLLDDLPAGGLGPSRTADIFVARPEGLYRWPTRMTSGPEGDNAVLSVLGPVRLLQRRVHPRVAVDVAAEVRRIVHGRRDRAREGRIADLSHGGMKLITEPPIEPGDRVEVAVDLDGRRLSLTGRVVMAHAGPGGGRVANITFGDETTNELSALDAYLARRLQEA